MRLADLGGLAISILLGRSGQGRTAGGLPFALLRVKSTLPYWGLLASHDSNWTTLPRMVLAPCFIRLSARCWRAWLLYGSTPRNGTLAALLATASSMLSP